VLAGLEREIVLGMNELETMLEVNRPAK